MDRNGIVRISRLTTFSGLTENDANMVLMQYYIEHEKLHYETAMFVINVLKSKQLLVHCLSIALSFYERKFTIYKSWSALNPLNNMGQERKLLQIF